MDNMNKTTEAQRLYALFDEYTNAYAGEWERLDRCERLYRADHWHGVPVTDRNEPRPVTPVIQSTIENVRADLMDMYPEAVITADSPEHAQIAELLSAAVNENHARTGYLKEYARLTHDLLVSGYMVQETGFDPDGNRGMGAAYIRHVDVRSIMFDPLCTDVQDSRAIFKFTPYTRVWFNEHYPDKAPLMKGDVYSVRRMQDGVLTQPDGDTVLLIECWTREYDAKNNLYSVHMSKLAGGIMLEDSRKIKPEGYYAHGEYPFVLTPLFARKGSCLGFGFADMFETQQLYSDKLDQIVLKNALMASHNKLLITGASGFDPDDLRDWSKDVHQGENLNGVTWFSTAPLPAYILTYIRSIRDGIKEESGSNDFSRGMTAGGVTAASAIAALQQMSNKRSRMASRAVHAAFEDAVRQEIEVEREFAVFERSVSVSGSAMPFSNAIMQKKTALGNLMPLEFFVSVKVQRENQFTTAAHNELMLSLAREGMIPRESALELMIFPGKEQAVEAAKKLRAQQEMQMASQSMGDGIESDAQNMAKISPSAERVQKNGKALLRINKAISGKGNKKAFGGTEK